MYHYIQGQGHRKGSKCQWMFVRMIPSEPQDILIPNRRSKIWLFLLGNHTWSDRTSSVARVSCEKNNNTGLLLSIKVRVTVKVKNVNVCLSRWYLLNCQTFCHQTWYCDASSWAGVSCKKMTLSIISWSVLFKTWIVVFKGDSEGSKLHWIFMYPYIFCTTDLLATKLGVLTYVWLIVKPSTRKWTYTDSNTLTYSITRHPTGRKVFCRSRPHTLFVVLHRTKISLCALQGQYNLCYYTG